MHVLLGRAAGLTEDKLAHLGDDPLPEGVYAPDEAAIVTYAQRSTRMEAIDDATYGPLAAHFGRRQLIEICFTVGLSNMVNRFHATFLTDIDPWMPQALGDSCPLPYPTVPTSGDEATG
jgi:alkylhydroperoxidase family enzyme